MEKLVEKQKVMNYWEYINFFQMLGLKPKFTDPFQNYIVYSHLETGSAQINVNLVDVEFENNNAYLYIWDKGSGVVASSAAYIIVVPTKENIRNVYVQPVYTEKEFYYIKKYGVPHNPYEWTSLDKPIIYLYPEETSEIQVKLGLPEKITCSYPQYTNSGWNVQVEPNGDLVDLSTKRNLYSLYYESENVIPFKVEDTGFVVKGSDSAKFLEEKLTILGLTETEAEEFIIYWLPKLEKNNYNYIRFATQEEINKNMPLSIEPNPDTIIRVLMTFKGLDKPIDVKEQKLTSPSRKGFVAVEWGGTEID